MMPALELESRAGAIRFLTTDPVTGEDAGWLRCPCCAWGRTSADVAPAVWFAACAMADASGEPITADLLESLMGSAVNDGDGILGDGIAELVFSFDGSSHPGGRLEVGEARELLRAQVADYAEGSPVRLALELALEPFAWPGGYQRYAVTDDGGVLCPSCCWSERARIADAGEGDGFFVVALTYCEDGRDPAELRLELGAAGESVIGCDHCGRELGA